MNVVRHRGGRPAAVRGGRLLQRGSRRARSLLVVAGLLGSTAGAVAVSAVTASPAAALPLSLKVTVTEIAQCCGSNFDSGIGPQADFYGYVEISGQRYNIPEGEDQDTYNPNFVAQRDVDDSLTAAPVRLAVFERDGTVFNGPDDEVDLSKVADATPRFVDLDIDLHSDSGSCTVRGNVSGPCGQELSSEGDENGRAARIKFKVELILPVTAAGSHVRCTHTSVWPQPGQTVTVTAESLGDQPPVSPTDSTKAAPMPPKVAKNLEIWFSRDVGVTRTVLKSANNTSTATATIVAGAAGSTFSYGCRVRTEVGPIFSGWRSTGVGNPPAGRAVALSVGESDRALAMDIVLVPATRAALRNPFNPNGGLLAQNPYSGPGDAAFLAEAARLLRSELLRPQALLDRQRRLNLWLLIDGGAAGGTRDVRDAKGNVGLDPDNDGIPNGDGAIDTCHVEVPATLAQAAPWANASALVHRDAFRDCSPGTSTFTSEQNDSDVFPHELGHAGFGLADEYCCDGGYFQPNPFPNTYTSLAACQADAPSLGRAAGACRGMDSVDIDTNADFWVSDPATNDLMNNNQTPQAADLRRISWALDTECAGRRC